MRAAVKVNPMDTLRQLPENKKCFDCQQKGTMYCVMNFHVFVCSSCAGIHREMTHKVKGISMCVFTEQELKDLADKGNANMQAKLMKKWKARNDPIPEKTDNAKMKAFFQTKYVQKKFAEEESEDSSEDSEEERARRKKKKDKKKAKAKKAAKKAASSSSEEEEAQAKPAKKAAGREEQKQEEDSDDAEEPVFKQKKGIRKRGLGAPPSSTNVLAQPKPAAQPLAPQVQQQPVAPAKVQKAKSQLQQPVAPPVQNNDVGSLLDFGSSAPVQQQQQVAAPQNDGFNDGGWDAFDSAPAQSSNQQAPVQSQPMMQQPVQQPQQPVQQQQQQPAPQVSTASLLDDVFGMPAATPQPAAQAAPAQGGFQPNQASFQPQMMNNAAGSSPDPFGQMFQGGNPGAPQGGAPNAMNAMSGGQQMPGQPMGAQMAGPTGQHQNPNAMAMQQQQQQMMMMQQRMQQMSLQGGQQNPMQIQQMQQQMQMMMGQMQQMMMQGQQPGAQGMGQQMPTQGGMGQAGYGGMQQQPVPNQMQNMQQMPMQPPAPQDSLSNLFNQVKNQPAAKPQQQQSSAEYNPFDM